MQKEGYWTKSLLTFRIIKNNPKLVIPDIILIFFSIIFGFLFLYLNNLFPILNYKPEIIKFNLKLLFNTMDLGRLLITLIIAFLFTFVIHLGTNTMRFYWISQAVLKRKIGFFQAYKESRKYLFSFFKY